MINISNTSPSFASPILSACTFTAILWMIKLFEVVFGWDLLSLGVYPQQVSGLIGIITAPLIHGSWEHLASNTLSVMLLGAILLYGYPKSCWWTVALIWLLSGIGVWVFGRPSYHIGASGLTHGVFFYLLISGILRRDKLSAALLMVAFYMYGGMLMTILPREVGISFEYHLFGGLSGVLCAVLFRHWDPRLAEKTYAWENEPDKDESTDKVEEDHSLIGDLWQQEPSAQAPLAQEQESLSSEQVPEGENREQNLTTKD
jgi:membrane associated rhomboid family serine protease